MEIALNPDQEAFIRRTIEAGRYHTAGEAVTEALHLLEERERRRAEFLASLDKARDSIERGEGMVITRESMQALAEDVKRRGRERRAAERQTPA